MGLARQRVVGGGDGVLFRDGEVFRKSGASVGNKEDCVALSTSGSLQLDVVPDY